MKIIIAADSFKGTMAADEVCEIIADAIVELIPDTEVIQKPMADGGEGTAKAMIKAANGKWIARTVMGPLPEMQVKAGFAWFKDTKTALIEMACASGLELLDKDQMNPLKTTTYGTGQLIKEAIEYGAKKIILAVGGSATVDGGIGAAMALGWEFVDNAGDKIELGGGNLKQIANIKKPQNVWNIVPVEVLCDVDNPLCGDNGAAKVYGPQKGATPEMVDQLEIGIAHLAALVKTKLGKDIDIPGAGAAGGLAAGAIAFMNAKLVSGIETVIAFSNLDSQLADSDWIITGEGSFDSQSLSGKVICGIAKMAQKYNIPTAVIAGQVNVSPEEYKKSGITAAISCRADDMSLEYALKNSRSLLQKAAQEFTREYLI